MIRRVALGLAAVALPVTCAGCGVSSSGSSAQTTVTVRSAAPPAETRPAASGLAFQAQLVRVVEDVSPSVVQIETNAGLGSGVVYDANGDIVTNAHVVGTAKILLITFADGEHHRAKLVGTFPPDDLAVVRVQGARPPAARFGHSGPLAVGDVVLAIGNPLGLRSSVTQGIVSSLGRTVSEGNGVALPSAIQTSAPINPGNSGGALVGLDSEVIGIPTLAALDPEFGATPAPGIGFAIPSETVRRIADQLIRSGRVSNSGRAFLGVRVASVLGGGVLVASVEPRGPAARAGLERGDRIVAVNKTPVTDTDQLAAVLARIKPGRTIPVEVIRNGRKLTLTVKAGALRGS